MTTKQTPKLILVICFLLALMISACAQAPVSPQAPTDAPAQAPTASQTPMPLTQAPSPLPSLTLTPAPTETVTPSPEPSATYTTAPTFGPLEDGISSWCLTEHGTFAAEFDPALPPANAKIGEWSGSALEVRNLPSNGCVFIFTFNLPAPAGLTLEVSDKSGAKPFISAALVPGTDPNSVYAVLRHTWIIAPPVWEVSFTFVVKDSSGTTLRTDQVNLHRWVPKLCWNGRPPNVFTLRCPLPQDLHPWDPSYGTPIPTFPPEED